MSAAVPRDERADACREPRLTCSARCPIVALVTPVMRVGETAAITLDELLLELSGLKVGDAVRVQWSEDGTLVVIPLGRPATKQELAASIRRVEQRQRPVIRKPYADGGWDWEGRAGSPSPAYVLMT